MPKANRSLGSFNDFRIILHFVSTTVCSSMAKFFPLLVQVMLGEFWASRQIGFVKLVGLMELISASLPLYLGPLYGPLWGAGIRSSQ